MELKIRQMDWFKRREPTVQIQPMAVEVVGLVLKDNHRCVMDVTYSDGVVYSLDSRVSVNDITGKWTVHGMNASGLSTLVDVIE